jgi:protein TonB
MGLSRSAFCSALCSCLAHSAALALAATLVVSSPPSLSHAVKVTLLQPAVPLPVGGNEDSGKGAPAPVTEKLSPIVPQPPQARPKPKAEAKLKPPVAQKPAPPAVVASPALVATPQQVVSLVLPPMAASDAEGIGADLSRTEASGNAGEDANGSGGRTGIGVGGEGGVGQGSGVSARPDYNVNPKPLYPLIARRLGAQGVVLLRVQVREDGSVAAVELARSSGFALLDDSATRTVRESWRFLPARVDGAPVASWVEVPIRFVLEDS